jgi:hypothetical protein
MAKITLVEELVGTGSSTVQTISTRVGAAPRVRIGAGAAVFAIAFAWFAAGVEQCGIASTFCDPVSRIDSQDESVYAREAIDMAAQGNWLTPSYLGRYALNKPPLMQMLAAAAVRVFGPSAFAVRLPSLLAASLTVALIFSLAWQFYSGMAAICAVLLLACSHLFYVFARFCMTDMLLTLWLVVAMFVLTRDPALRRRRSFWAFSACCGAAILTKAAAGALPVIALLIYVVIAPRTVRPSWKRVGAVLAAAMAFALPWHLYQLAVHGRWFVAEYIWTAHIMVGVAAPPQYSNENHLMFYARRMFLMDPVLSLCTAAAAALMIRNWRRGRGSLSAMSVSIATAWIAAALLALLAFRYRSAYYLLPLIPALAFATARSFAQLSPRAQSTVLVLLVVCCTVKASSSSPVWGIPVGQSSERAAAPALERYCGLERGNGLIVVDPNDEFYASALPIAQVRYVLMQGLPPAPPIDFAWLGIWMPAAQFTRFEEWRPLYRARLRAFAVNSDRAVGTVIWARTPGDIARIVETHPESDFSLPARMAWSLGSMSAHTTLPERAGRVFLLSKMKSHYAEARACHL